MRTHLDTPTWTILVITLILFGVALFVKGFSHDLLLEGAVFLVSVKLVLITYKTSVRAEILVSRLDNLKTCLDRIEQKLRNHD